MNEMEVALDVALALLGGAGLFKGLSEFFTAPLSAALIILGAMGLLMYPVASLCGVAVRHTGVRKKWK